MEHQQANVDNSMFLAVSPEKAGMRLDSFLGCEIESYSRTFLQGVINKGLVVVNGTPTKKPAHRVSAADQISIVIPQFTLPDAHPSARQIAIEIVHADKHFFIINKPPFLSVHAPHLNSRMPDPTLVDWIVATYQDLKDVGLQDRPGIVHRLDKNTSGLMIVARTNYAHRVFTGLFRDRAIKKSYLAIVNGHPDREGSIDFCIIRDPVHKVKMLHARSGGREALTHYVVKEYFSEHSLVEASPVTGRTHQIRVHFSAIGNSILGDTKYGTSSKFINRHALHAWRLSFVFDEKEYNFECLPPEDMQETLKKISGK